MKLSVLICTISSRTIMYNELIAFLGKQKYSLPNHLLNEVEIIGCADETINVGQKRNLLLDEAKGDFIVFVDDDDTISEDYLLSILNCINDNPDIDCVGIEGIITFNGQNLKRWYISIDYGSWFERDNVYYRTPNHISPIRRNIALKVKFPEIKFAEDFEYSTNIFPYLKKEAKIQKSIYNYNYIDK